MTQCEGCVVACLHRTLSMGGNKNAKGPFMLDVLYVGPMYDTPSLSLAIDGGKEPAATYLLGK